MPVFRSRSISTVFLLCAGPAPQLTPRYGKPAWWRRSRLSPKGRRMICPVACDAPGAAARSSALLQVFVDRRIQELHYTGPQRHHRALHSGDGMQRDDQRRRASGPDRDHDLFQNVRLYRALQQHHVRYRALDAIQQPTDPPARDDRRRPETADPADDTLLPPPVKWLISPCHHSSSRNQENNTVNRAPWLLSPRPIRNSPPMRSTKDRTILIPNPLRAAGSNPSGKAGPSLETDSA